MYKCKKCKKKFPIVAWIKTVWPPQVPHVAFGTPSRVQGEIKKPCCPYCHEIEIQEV